MIKAVGQPLRPRGVRRGGDTTQPLPLLLALLDHAPAVVGAAAPPRTKLLRAFGTCARASRAGAARARAPLH